MNLISPIFVSFQFHTMVKESVKWVARYNQRTRKFSWISWKSKYYLEYHLAIAQLKKKHAIELEQHVIALEQYAIEFEK